MAYNPFQLKQTKTRKVYMCIVSRNGRMTWRTPGDYERRAGAIKATHAAAKAFAGKWDGKYIDKTTKPNIKKPK